MNNKEKTLKEIDWADLDNELTDIIIFIDTLINDFYGPNNEILETCKTGNQTFNEVKRQQEIVFKILFKLLSKQVLTEHLKNQKN